MPQGTGMSGKEETVEQKANIYCSRILMLFFSMKRERNEKERKGKKGLLPERSLAIVS